MDFPYGITVTLRSTVTATDDYGNETTVVTESAWGPCAVAPRTSSESTDPHSPALIVGQTVYGPEVSIDSDDVLVIDGEEWQVEGMPGVWRSPFTGWAPGIEVPIKKAGT